MGSGQSKIPIVPISNPVGSGGNIQPMANFSPINLTAMAGAGASVAQSLLAGATSFSQSINSGRDRKSREKIAANALEQQKREAADKTFQDRKEDDDDISATQFWNMFKSAYTNPEERERVNRLSNTPEGAKAISRWGSLGYSIEYNRMSKDWDMQAARVEDIHNLNNPGAQYQYSTDASTRLLTKATQERESAVVKAEKEEVSLDQARQDLKTGELTQKDKRLTNTETGISILQKQVDLAETILDAGTIKRAAREKAIIDLQIAQKTLTKLRNDSLVSTGNGQVRVPIGKLKYLQQVKVVEEYQAKVLTTGVGTSTFIGNVPGARNLATNVAQVQEQYGITGGHYSQVSRWSRDPNTAGEARPILEQGLHISQAAILTVGSNPLEALDYITSTVLGVTVSEAKEQRIRNKTLGDVVGTAEQNFFNNLAAVMSSYIPDGESTTSTAVSNVIRGESSSISEYKQRVIAAAAYQYAYSRANNKQELDAANIQFNDFQTWQDYENKEFAKISRAEQVVLGSADDVRQLE